VPSGEPSKDRVTGAAPQRHAKVCILTRTKNRNLMLARAGRSVREQTYADYCWVVVNDGGNEAEARAVVESSGIDPERFLFLSNERSQGMEAASNRGIRAIGSDYIVVLDDDDSWDPAFLERCVDFLDGEDGRAYGGVVTYSTYVSEFVREDEIVEVAQKPYQDKLTSVDLDTVIDRNLFPVNSFLFRRSIYDQVGGYDETLPVLGDWLFNMEFLLRANIGVIREPLAFYHHRDSAEHTAPEYQNTVVNGLGLHEKYTSIVRNDFIRRNLGHSALAFRMAVAGAGGATGLSAPSQPRFAHAALPAPIVMARGDNDLTWTISAINARLAERKLKTLYKYRKIKPLPPSAPWNVVLPILRDLEFVVPPPKDFDEKTYLRTYPDVAESIRSGDQPSGFMHFLMHGRSEGRARTSGEYHPPAPASPTVVHDEASRVRPVFDSPLMKRHAQAAEGFERVLHIAHHEWHGVRQSAAYCPGNKLLISAHEYISDDDRRTIAEEVSRRGINRVCIQGYSSHADALLQFLRSALGPTVKFYVVMHANTAQFDSHSEMQVIAKLQNRRRFGVLDGLASVKPDFGTTFEEFWPRTIINYAPNLPPVAGRRAEKTEVYSPLAVGFLKNLYSNIIAASLAQNVDIVKTAHFPNGLEDIFDLKKVRLVGYLRGRELLDEMARSTLTLAATLAECQPMTQLESFAVGTPSLTRPLEVAEFADDELMKLCTTYHLDNPALLARDIEKIVGLTRSDPRAIEQMIGEHLASRYRLANQAYADFLEL
jgi:glycosyltransferase involved in cell wall biosynthesis